MGKIWNALFNRKKETPVEAAGEEASKGKNSFFTSDRAIPRKLIDGFDASEYDKRVFQVTPDNMVSIGTDGKKSTAMDSFGSGGGDIKSQFTLGNQAIPERLLDWFVAQSFIGYQACSLIAQQWLVDKACRMPGVDAVRNGFRITSNTGEKVDMKHVHKMHKANKKFKLDDHLKRAVHFNRVYGIRHILFVVDGVNTEKPFNPDGVKKGSYKGMVQIDPYWITPELDQEAVSNPAAEGFYEPTWWRVYGKRYHKSHFVILRGPEVSDILKPSYLYGGLPLAQRIFERVYAAERTANEAPQLAMTKRLTTLNVDMTAALANERDFQELITQWSEIRDNFGIKVLGLDEEAHQKDTSLADLDDVIGQQYQLVASIANIPATKLMGTSPEGFQSNGEEENKNYREGLESIQEEDMTPIVDRHMTLMLLSQELEGFSGTFDDYEVVWNPTNVPTMKELADTNYTKANQDSLLRTTGAIGPKDVRRRIVSDALSGYDGLDVDDIPEEGYTPPDGGNEDKPENSKEAKINAPQTNTSPERASKSTRK